MKNLDDHAWFTVSSSSGKGLLSYDLDTQTFKTTEKGLRSLETYKQMDSMIKAANNNNDNKSRCSREEKIDYNHTGSMILINAQSDIGNAPNLVH